jgi:hypothetical protein
METRTRAKPAGGKLTAGTKPAGMERVNPLDNPEKANAEIAALLEGTKSDLPTISFPADDLVNLPGGLIKDGKVIRTALVRELNGSDEEALARASQSGNPFHFVDRLLRCGVVQIGDSTSTDALLNEMLVGDREALILGIRNATYGDKLNVDGWRCTNCGASADLAMALDNIPLDTLDDPASQINFEVNLRKGRTAKVRLANGADQTALYDKKELTQAERETILLSRCIFSITESSGIMQNIAAFPSLVLKMSIPDRHTILDELTRRQPGPKMDKISYKCDTCGEEVFVTVGIGDLFLDIRWI